MSKLDWNISPQTLKTDLRANALKRAIRAACDVPEEQFSDLNYFALLLSCTTSIEFDRERARPALREFDELITTWQHMDAGELWTRRQDIAGQIWWAWVAAFNQGQELFETDPAELPLTALTEEQRQEAETPGSPLT